MKLNILLVNLFLIIKITLAEENGLSNIIYSKTVVDPSNGECRVVNKMLGKDESFDCCNILNVIECENRHITKIHIENKNITGHIPDEIGNLIYLRELWLDHNQLTGRIPTSIGNIVYLRDLSLGANNLYGPIPTELSKLTDLEKLNLYENNLFGKIPHELGDLSNLWHLDFHNNSLHGEVPFELGKLSKLRVLNLDYNKLDITSIPQQIQNLPNLTEFHYTNQSELKEKSDSSTNNNNRNASGGFFGIITVVLGLMILIVICCGPIVLIGDLCDWIKGKKKEKKEDNKRNWEVLNNKN